MASKAVHTVEAGISVAFRDASAANCTGFFTMLLKSECPVARFPGLFRNSFDL
jgi:hypothetical protein